MNPVELLMKDHQTVAKLFEQVQSAEDERAKGRIFQHIKAELEAHTHIEETVFYPAVQRAEGLDEMVLEAFEEHKEVKNLLLEISTLIDGNESLDSKLKELEQSVEQHVLEEESELFPRVEEMFEEAELNRLGNEMQTMKKEFQKTEKIARSASS